MPDQPVSTWWRGLIYLKNGQQNRGLIAMFPGWLAFQSDDPYRNPSDPTIVWLPTDQVASVVTQRAPASFDE